MMNALIVFWGCRGDFCSYMNIKFYTKIYRTRMYIEKLPWENFNEVFSNAGSPLNCQSSMFVSKPASRSVGLNRASSKLFPDVRRCVHLSHISSQSRGGHQEFSFRSKCKATQIPKSSPTELSLGRNSEFSKNLNLFSLQNRDEQFMLISALSLHPSNPSIRCSFEIHESEMGNQELPNQKYGTQAHLAWTIPYDETVSHSQCSI